jgi:hypothetical protein
VRGLAWSRVSGITSIVLAAAVAGGVALAAETRSTVVETFDAASNEGGWTFGTGNEFIVEANGNPGFYLRDTSLVTFHPRASTSFGVASAFTGDWRARGVSSIGIDLAIASVNGGVSSRTVSVVLLNDNGTPDDLGDDWGAYTVTSLPVPPVGVIGLAPADDILQWRSYDVAIPSSETRLPEGWTWIFQNQVRPNGAWGRLMRDVDHVGFVLGDLAAIYPLFSWDVAMDNPRITTVP